MQILSAPSKPGVPLGSNHASGSPNDAEASGRTDVIVSAAENLNGVHIVFFHVDTSAGTNVRPKIGANYPFSTNPPAFGALQNVIVPAGEQIEVYLYHGNATYEYRDSYVINYEVL